MMRSHWKVWLNTTNEAASARITKWYFEEMGLLPHGLRLTDDDKGSRVADFWVDHATDAWNDFIVDVIRLAQRVGYEWCLTGNVEDQLDGWSTKSRVTGVTAAQWICDQQHQS